MNALASHDDDQTKAAGQKMIEESKEWLLFSINKEQHDRIGYLSEIGKLTMIGLLEIELLRLRMEFKQEIGGVNDEEDEE